jgi:hypothetical protein
MLSGRLALQFPEVASLVLQHAQDLSTARDICSLLQVSTAVRRAVQQSRGHCSITLSTQAHPLGWLSGFSTWLPAHCGLVSDLELNHSALSAAGTADIAAAALQLAFRVCVEQAAQPRQPLTVAAAVDSSVLQDAAPPPLRLSCFSAGALASPAVLRLLAALGLRELKLQLQPEEVTSALCSALSQMHSVQQMEVDLQPGVQLPLCLAAAVGQLSQLTRLQVTSVVGSGTMQALPASLEDLCLTMEIVHQDEVLDFSHLTALSRLDIANETLEQMQLVLPAQPGLRMQLEGRADIQPGSGLNRLAVSAWVPKDLCSARICYIAIFANFNSFHQLARSAHSFDAQRRFSESSTP